MAPSIEVSVVSSERLFPETPPPSGRAVPLSLLDATTANFAVTEAIWLFERPRHVTAAFNLAQHLKQALQTTLTAYPQWCGQCKAVTAPSGPTEDTTRDFPPHARRFGRIYAHFGISEDPGVGFVTATSSATLDSLYPGNRTESLPLWNRREADLKVFAPGTAIHSTLQPNNPDDLGLRKPLLAIQLTQLACGGFVLAAKSTHPMADIATLARLVKDWGKVSGPMLHGEPLPMSSPVFDPALLDACAGGDINAEAPDADTLEKDRSPPMPWKDWDFTAPVASYIIHLSSKQVDYLYSEARRGQVGANSRLSKHDAVLAHIWSCVARARLQQEDHEAVHCDLTIGVRPALQLGEDFLGSPVLLVNVEMTGAEAAAVDEDNSALRRIVRAIRSTIGAANDKGALAAHLHRLAFEKSPQRIWQAFLGSRHCLVTTWARAGIYEVDFGLGSAVRYADGVVPEMDGCILIKEAPPAGKVLVAGQKVGWTDHGVDISVALKAEDMERLLKDPLLLPTV
ncbi:Transferase family protein [Coniochaeta hoffmannii]|uniref:Transferase family protein n=1 Tax=Coniochaeta hoffmannii TaxID=91930 RepID=A0AA38VJ19_9PEZI|nr:Transferase family protein [Coniochaeta hoffmannii]